MPSMGVFPITPSSLPPLNFFVLNLISFIAIFFLISCCQNVQVGRTREPIHGSWIQYVLPKKVLNLLIESRDPYSRGSEGV